MPTIPEMLDNKSTIKRLTNGKNSEMQKSVDYRFFPISDAVNSGDLHLTYCSTTIMLADFLTKALGMTRLRELRSAIGVEELAKGIHSSAGREVLK
ncbi:hypothetical protein PC116_g23559 [Phytophthora cactorum]|uniref:Uncharacterized protein n=1 Tax=Phytophthora cactorum TaxID=29920 RepID=A0A329RNV1_9STRA|nr:hypothetical protein Pcac1_g25752 [Phytophthora cactorum]KAG2903854.1 hypothetical protein PC117_g21165 [Phytophthora cactorum]KAG2912484.1 hypothetical protein PC114_g8906 [Phytophthora cactorum]KAG4228071.1 hypothetical protein PC116_g23559 [Phytophthora cactorum]RAW25366.1 hypothetical protein PC110_g18222 [Phytophthora cactorum]